MNEMIISQNYKFYLPPIIEGQNCELHFDGCILRGEYIT